MRPKNRLFKSICVTVVLATVLSISPQNIAQKHIDLGNVTGNVIRTTEKLWHSVSTDIYLDILMPIKHFFFEHNNAPAPDFQTTSAAVGPDKETDIKSPSGKITLKIPAGAVMQQTDIEFNEYSPQSSTGMVMLNRFDLNAKDTTSGKTVSNFSKDLEITINHTPEELAGLDIDSLRLYYLDEKTKQWVPVTTGKYDPKEQTIKATTNHFSNYGEQANPTIVGPGKVTAAQVNLNSGTATFSYPFELPSGPGGFQPKLELSYNSGSVDEMKNKQDVSSWVGIGWSFNLGRISYDALTSTYSLELNGLSYSLVSTDGINFQTNPDSYLRIYRYNVTSNTWEVTDKEGNYYRFGGTTDSQQYINSSGTQSYYRWDMNLFKDTNNNQATVSYVQDTQGTSPNEWIRSAYPVYLNYGSVQIHFTCGYDDSTSDGYLRHDNPITYGSNPAPKVMENRRLNSIEINVSGNLLRKYTFAYNTTNRVYSTDYSGVYYSGEMTLTSITQVGADGTSALPAISFTYQDLQTHRHTSDTSYSGNPGNPANFNWAHLTAINSGYGGTISFSYTQIPNTSAANIWTREVVTTKTIDSGIGNTETHTYNYTGNPQYMDSVWEQHYLGFGEVKETDAAGNYTKHWFYTKGLINGINCNRLAGKEYKVQCYDINDNLLSEKNYDWGWTDTSSIKNCFVSDWSSLDYTNQLLIFPEGIAISNDNYVYVTTGYGTNSPNEVEKFDEDGNFVTKWGSYGTNDGQFSSPAGIAVDSNGYVYVADENNSRIQKFSSDGSFICKWGVYGTQDGQFNVPIDVAVDSNGYVYVVDYANSRIQKFDSSGNFILKWGTRGSDDGQLLLPRGVVIDNQGNVYVADGSNMRIQEFSSNGNFIRKWGSQGTGDGQFMIPMGITVDSTNYVYVTDVGNRRIQVFGSGGNFVTKWGREGSSLGNFGQDWYCGVSTSSIFVTDFLYNRVEEFTKNWAVQLNKEEVTTYKVGDTNTKKTTRTEYTYDSYSNVTTENDWGDTGITTDNSIITRTYNANTTTNIIDKVATEKVYLAADDTFTVNESNLKQQTNYYYDGNNTALTTPPTKGMVTRVESKKDASNSVSTYSTYDSYGNVLTSVDANSNTTTTGYDTTYHIYPISKTYPVTGLSESCTFDAGTGNVLTHTDVNSQVTSYEYDTFKRLTKTIKPGDSSGSPSITYQYNSWGTINSQNLETITKIDGSTSIWSADYFDGLGRVVQTQAQSETTGHTMISGTTTFNTCGQVDKQYVSQDIASSLTSYQTPQSGWKYSTSTYDALGRVVTQTAADGTTVNSDYTNVWQMLTTNELGNKIRYYYDAFRRLVKVEELNTDQSVYATTNYTYDTIGNLTQVVDNANNTTMMSYDWLARKTGMTDPDMGAWSYGYDGNGNLTTQTDAKSQPITMIYDAMNRLTNKNYPTGSGMTNVVYTYDTQAANDNGNGKRTKMTDAMSDATHPSTYKYDNRGRVSEEKRWEYSNGTWNSYTTSYTYDGLDRAFTVTYPTGEIVTNTYNGRGLPNTVSGSVAGNMVTGTTYNQLGAITQINLGNNLKTNYSYWGLDQGTTAYGKLWEIKTQPQSGGTALQDMQYTWDGASNLTQRQNLVSTETENFTYDALDRLTGVSGAYTQSYTYTTIGNIATMNGNTYTYSTQPHAVTAVSANSYTYDGNGNMVTATAGTGNVVNTLTLTNGGSGYTSVPSVTINGGGGSGATATTTLAPRAVATINVTNGGSGYTSAPTVTITDGGGSGGAATAVLAGRTVSSITVSNQGSGYNSAPSVTISGGGGSGATATAHISNHKVTSITINNHGSGYTSVPSVSLSGGGGSGAQGTAVLSSAAVASLTLTNGGSGYTSTPTVGFSGGNGSGAAATAVLSTAAVAGITLTNGGSGYTSVPSVTISGSGSGAAATATLSSNSKTYGWDVENRVISVTGGATFVYDGDGNRVKKTEGGQTILYINRYYEKNMTTGAVTTYYYFGGQLVAQSIGGTLKYIHQDSLGSTSVMSTSTGTLDSSMTFFPFGLCRFSPPYPTAKLFTGQRLDSTGLYYYGARYYDASIGRFISPDTVVQDYKNPQTLNRYAYCSNNPLKYTDPTGQDQIITTGGVNDNGETWYTICDGQGNLLAIATGIDDLAQKMNDCDAVSRNVDLPLGQGAKDYFDAINGKTNSGPSFNLPEGPSFNLPQGPTFEEPKPPLPGYLDINFSYGFGGDFYFTGITGGLMRSNDGSLYPYFGGGFMTPGFSWATTSSNSNPVTGLNVGLQAGWGVGGQIGYSFGNGGGRFDEEGVVSPGASATVFWVWKLPWKWQINIPKIHF